jgi:hypothetical protein
MPAHAYRNSGDALAWITPGFYSFFVGGPSSLARSGEAISGMGCMIAQPFAAGGNRS